MIQDFQDNSVLAEQVEILSGWTTLINTYINLPIAPPAFLSFGSSALSFFPSWGKGDLCSPDHILSVSHVNKAARVSFASGCLIYIFITFLFDLSFTSMLLCSFTWSHWPIHLKYYFKLHVCMSIRNSVIYDSMCHMVGRFWKIGHP